MGLGAKKIPAMVSAGMEDNIGEIACIYPRGIRPIFLLYECLFHESSKTGIQQFIAI